MATAPSELSPLALSPPKHRRKPTPRAWRRYKGELNPEVYSTFFPIPLAPGLDEKDKVLSRNLIKILATSIPAPALRQYWHACIDASNDGVFDMSANQARIARGCEPRRGDKDKGDPYLMLLVKMGLFHREESGYRDSAGKAWASTYRLVHWRPEMYDQAMRAIYDFQKRYGGRRPSLVAHLVFMRCHSACRKCVEYDRLAAEARAAPAATVEPDDDGNDPDS